MAEKKNAVTYISLRKEIESGKFRPIYILHGAEPYYIDKLSELIVDKALSPEERDFNLSIYYGSDCDVRDVITTCKQYPAFSQYKVVVLRESQLAKNLDLFKHYADNPLRSTILVVCNKGGDIKAKPFVDMVNKQHTGVVFASNPPKSDRDLHALISSYSTSMGCNIDEKSVRMMADSIGKDLSRMFSELDKLKLLVGDDNRITPELIEKNIGISKDYNIFELQDALTARNALKSYRIIDYFERNPKENPVVKTVSGLFSFFSSVLLYATCRDRSPQALMAATGARFEWQLRKYGDVLKRYNKRSLVNIIGYLRECDVRSKGIGSRQDQYALQKELIYKILHS